jgi:RNA polymerase primary sigma factor
MTGGSKTRRLLTAAEEVRLAKRIERGDPAARAEMIERNLGLVHAAARPYRGRGVPYDDLVQEGTIGLVRAVDKFDYRRGLRLSTYAMWWIRSSLLEAIGAEPRFASPHPPRSSSR